MRKVYVSTKKLFYTFDFFILIISLISLLIIWIYSNLILKKIVKKFAIQSQNNNQQKAKNVTVNSRFIWSDYDYVPIKRVILNGAGLGQLY